MVLLISHNWDVFHFKVIYFVMTAANFTCNWINSMKADFCIFKLHITNQFRNTRREYLNVSILLNEDWSNVIIGQESDVAHNLLDGMLNFESMLITILSYLWSNCSVSRKFYTYHICLILLNDGEMVKLVS